MPAGTWNLPEIRKTVPYRGIKDISTIEVFDISAASDNYFNVIEFPDRLTSGKNLFKFNAANTTLVDNSEIHIEILDYNGDPIYYEPLTYLEQDGTRVVSIYVYPDTSPGLATVYIAGRALVDVFDNNRLLQFTETLQAGSFEQNRLFKDYPNLLWSRTINVAPEKYNTSQIIFTQQPRVTVTERVVAYQQPVTLNNVNVEKLSNGISHVTVAPIPSQGGLIANASSINSSYALAPANLMNSEGAGSRNTPLRSLGAPVATVGLFSGQSGLDVDTSNNNSILSAFESTVADDREIPGQQTSQGITINAGFSLMTISGSGFQFSASMEGGMIAVKNPKLSLDLGTALQDGQVISAADVPVSSDGRGFPNYVPDQISTQITAAMSGSVVFIINDVESTTQAKVSQLAGPGHNAPVLTSFNFVAFKSANNAQNLNGTLSNPIAYDIKSIEASADFTSSHTEPLVLSVTDQSQSFAEVILANIEPATGDVYKIRTSYKPAGQFGDFISAGETVLERFDLLEDTSSFEGAMAIGQIYNRMGHFTSLSDVQTYFENIDDSGVLGGTGFTFDNDTFINGVFIENDDPYDTTDNAACGISLKDGFLPTVEKDSEYAITFQAKCVTGIAATDSLIFTEGNKTVEITKPRFDVYISGSKGNIVPVATTFDAYRLTDYNIAPTLPDELADDGELGKLIGVIEMPPSNTVEGFNSIQNIALRFKSLARQNVKVSVILRSGTFAIRRLSMTTDNETGFTPNHMRLNIRIPSEYINVPMIFKFEYLDYLGNKADTETSVFPIKFTGDNVVITGGSNLITGSVYIGNTMGAGLELAGVRSGFIRAIGYEGFLSASRTDKPGGFLMYTGSVLPDAPDNYDGVGIEIVEHSESFLRFATSASVSGKPAGLEIRTPNFFLGSEAAGNFISGSNGEIAITSSNFELTTAGDVIMQGAITVEAGGTIGGWILGENSISSSGDHDISLISGNSPKIRLAGETPLNYLEMYYNGDTDYGLHAQQDNSTIFAIGRPLSFTGGTNIIAGWEFDNQKFTGENIIISKSGEIRTADFQSAQFGTGKGYKLGKDGIAEFEEARVRGTLSTAVFEKDTVSAVGGALIVANATAIRSGSVVLNNLANTGHATQADDCTINNRTQVTFNDSTNIDRLKPIVTQSGQHALVNGRVYKAKATISSYGGSNSIGFATEGGIDSTSGRRSSNGDIETTFTYTSGEVHVFSNTSNTGVISNITIEEMSLPVDNAAGFVAGEYLIAKATSSTGFIEEIMKIDSVGTDILHVSRSMNGNLIASMSAGQVIVSQGKQDTGYILLNATSGSETPYIDITERTGSELNDLEIRARLGDLSGINDNINGTSVSGFGLYTQNAFLKGGIVATYGSIGGLTISDHTFGITDVIEISDTTEDYFISSSGFQVNHAGAVTASGALITGNSTFQGQLEVVDQSGRKQHRLFARGGDFNNQSTHPAFVQFGLYYTASAENFIPFAHGFAAGDNGQLNRGHALFIISSSLDTGGSEQLDVRYHRIFDTHGNADASGSFLADILTGATNVPYQSTAINSKDVLVIVSHDATKINLDLWNALTASGATNPSTTNSSHEDNTLAFGGSGTSRTPYVLIGQKGIGRGNGFEAVGRYDEADEPNGSAIVEAFYSNGRLTAAASAVGTQILGDKLRTGQIQSNNLSDVSGSVINLDKGTISLGGTTDPNFSVDEFGRTVAATIREKFVSVNDANSGSYLRHISGTGTNQLKNLVFDGSLGGKMASNMEISTSLRFIINDVELANTGSDKTVCNVWLLTDNMRFNTGSMSTYNTAATTLGSEFQYRTGP